MSGNPVDVNKAPRPAGPYSAAVWAGDSLFISGQAPIEPGSANLVEGGCAAQAEQVFDNIESLLAHAGLGMPDVVKTIVYLASPEHFMELIEVEAVAVKSCKPAAV